MCGSFLRELQDSVQGLRALFFPRKCLVCGCFLPEEDKDVCRTCLDDLPLTWQWDIVQNAAFERLARRFEVEAAASLLFFGTESDYRRIVYAFKYGGRQQLACRMGRILGTYLKQSREFARCQAVVPVPLHPLRRWKRGYNQAELIARGVAEEMGLPVETKLLHRRRNTKTQTKLHGAAKTRNVQGAFVVDSRRAATIGQQGVRHLLLVDDVLTTGSTLKACAVPLQAAGFRLSATTIGFAG